MSKLTQSQLLLKAFFLVIKSGIFPETSLRQWPGILLFLHKKGFLFVGFEKEEPVVVAAAYRVKKKPKEFPKNYPEKEEGDILYVPWLVSFADDKFLPIKLMHRYLKTNPDIKTVAFHDHSENDKLKVFDRKQEAKHG